MSDTQDWAKLDESLEQEFPESIRLDDDNPKFLGIFKRVDWGQTEYGQCPIAVLEDPKSGKEYGLWMFHAVLRNQFAKCAPRVGEAVGVRYLGKKKGASGREYSNYVVKRIPDASAEAFDWAEIADESVNLDIAPADDAPVKGWDDMPTSSPLSPTPPAGNPTF